MPPRPQHCPSPFGALIGAMLAGGGAMAQDGGAVSPTLCRATGPVAEPADCSLEVEGLALLFVYAPGDAPTLRIEQSTAEGGQRDVSAPLRLSPPVEAPALWDLDDDGIDDLLIPVGAVGPESPAQTIAVWRLGPDGFYLAWSTLVADNPGDVAAAGDLIVARATLDGAITESGYLIGPEGLSPLYTFAIDPETGECTPAGDGGTDQNVEVLLADCSAREGVPE